MHRFAILLVTALTLGGTAVSANADVRASFSVSVGPPPPRSIVVDDHPRDGYFWVEGNWQILDDHWVWYDGYWERERPGYVYINGYWDHRGSHHYWVPGTWQRARIGYAWNRGHWAERDGRYVWNRGRWQRARAGHDYRSGYWANRDGRNSWVDGSWVARPRVRDHRRHDHYVNQHERPYTRPPIRNEVRRERLYQPAPQRFRGPANPSHTRPARQPVYRQDRARLPDDRRYDRDRDRRPARDHRRGR